MENFLEKRWMWVLIGAAVLWYVWTKLPIVTVATPASTAAGV